MHHILNELGSRMKKTTYFIIPLFGLIFLSRLMFLSSDLGNDADAYRFGLNAEKIVEDYRYYMSRSPGNPVYELLNAPLLVFGGGWLTNLMTVLVSTAGLLAYYLILKYYNISKALWLLCIFAFVPVVWMSSIITMDYWWSLTLLLWAYYLTLINRNIWGAVFIGLATGCRLPSAFFILPILVVVWDHTHSWRRVVATFMIFSITSICSWLPVLLTYKFNNFEFVPYAHPFYVGAYRAVRQVFGVLGLFLILFAIGFSLVRHRPITGGGKNCSILERLSIYFWIIITVGVFIRLPADPAYLLPGLPFLFILLNSLMAAYWWIPVGILIILNNFISFIAIDSEAYKSSKSLSIKVASTGVLLKDRMDAWKSRQLIEKLAALSSDLSVGHEKSIILVGSLLPQLRYTLRSQISGSKLIGQSPYDIEIIKINGCWFGRILSLVDFGTFTAEGHHVHYTDNARYITQYTFNYDLQEYGAVEAFR